MNATRKALTRWILVASLTVAASFDAGRAPRRPQNPAPVAKTAASK